MKKFFQSKGFIVSSLALLCTVPEILDRMNPHPAASPAIGQMAARRQMVIMEQMLMPPASPQTPKRNILK